MTDTQHPHEPHIQILKGRPTDQELAALIAVLGSETPGFNALISCRRLKPSSSGARKSSRRISIPWSRNTERAASIPEIVWGTKPRSDAISQHAERIAALRGLGKASRFNDLREYLDCA